MNPQTIARVTGVLFLITFITSIPAFFFYVPVLDDPRYIVGAGADTSVSLGAFLELILIIANIGTAVVLFPILRRQNESLALGYVTARLVECVFIAVGILSLLTVVTLRQLPQRALGSLRTHRKRQLEERVGASRYGDSGLVFATGIGTPFDAQNIVNRHFKPLLKRAGLPSIRWHDLRHTYATLLLARGTHPTYVQKSLGHASVQLTLDRYSHWISSMGRATAEGMDEALG